ncbi:MAG: PadR family transcriptional regulator [Caldilineaceae bacterium]
MSKKFRRSGIALAVMAFLYESPMHPYRMQQLIKQRGKDEVINVRQRASLYQTIDRLLEVGLIVVRQVERGENRPERTIYALTEEGRTTMLAWLRAMLAEREAEFPQFPAALAYLALLAPDDARQQLEQRMHQLAAEIERINAQLAAAAEIPRLFLIEAEYVRSMLQTELAWVTAVVDDLKTGRLTWNADWIREVAAQLEPGEQGEEHKEEQDHDG